MVSDAIVNQYYVKCRDARITLKCSGAFPDGLSVEMTDLCVLMSNGLENAYKAIASCSGNREIQFWYEEHAGGSVRWRYDAKNGIVETKICLKGKETARK